MHKVVEATPELLAAIQASAVPYGVSMLVITGAIVAVVLTVGLKLLKKYTVQQAREEGSADLRIFVTLLIMGVVTLAGTASIPATVAEMIDKTYTPELYLAKQNNPRRRI